eukprot:gb/GECG01006513.1/.p1 GENE.gb/GECG01006513.1/~~gb/GECG01006513.1/.p1  ORF type:complete len:1720 (+),score=191.95 gb/GECG01006513.1/:1-5160(+)
MHPWAPSSARRRACALIVVWISWFMAAQGELSELCPKDGGFTDVSVNKTLSCPSFLERMLNGTRFLSEESGVTDTHIGHASRTMEVYQDRITVSVGNVTRNGGLNVSTGLLVSKPLQSGHHGCPELECLMELNTHSEKPDRYVVAAHTFFEDLVIWAEEDIEGIEDAQLFVARLSSEANLCQVGDINKTRLRCAHVEPEIVVNSDESDERTPKILVLCSSKVDSNSSTFSLYEVANEETTRMPMPSREEVHLVPRLLSVSAELEFISQQASIVYAKTSSYHSGTYPPVPLIGTEMPNCSEASSCPSISTSNRYMVLAYDGTGEILYKFIDNADETFSQWRTLHEIDYTIQSLSSRQIAVPHIDDPNAVEEVTVFSFLHSYIPSMNFAYHSITSEYGFTGGPCSHASEDWETDIPLEEDWSILPAGDTFVLPIGNVKAVEGDDSSCVEVAHGVISPGYHLSVEFVDVCFFRPKEDPVPLSVCGQAECPFFGEHFLEESELPLTLRYCPCERRSRELTFASGTSKRVLWDGEKCTCQNNGELSSLHVVTDFDGNRRLLVTAWNIFSSSSGHRIENALLLSTPIEDALSSSSCVVAESWRKLNTSGKIVAQTSTKQELVYLIRSEATSKVALEVVNFAAILGVQEGLTVDPEMHILFEDCQDIGNEIVLDDEGNPSFLCVTDGFVGIMVANRTWLKVTEAASDPSLAERYSLSYVDGYVVHYSDEDTLVTKYVAMDGGDEKRITDFWASSSAQQHVVISAVNGASDESLVPPNPLMSVHTQLGHVSYSRLHLSYLKLNGNSKSIAGNVDYSLRFPYSRTGEYVPHGDSFVSVVPDEEDIRDDMGCHLVAHGILSSTGSSLDLVRTCWGISALDSCQLPTPTPTTTATPTSTSTQTVTATASVSATLSPTSSVSSTSSPSNTPTTTASNTVTPSLTSSVTGTPSVTASNTGTPSFTSSQTSTPSNTPSHTGSPSMTPSPSMTLWVPQPEDVNSAVNVTSSGPQDPLACDDDSVSLIQYFNGCNMETVSLAGDGNMRVVPGNNDSCKDVSKCWSGDASLKFAALSTDSQLLVVTAESIFVIRMEFPNPNCTILHSYNNSEVLLGGVRGEHVGLIRRVEGKLFFDSYLVDLGLTQMSNLTSYSTETNRQVKSLAVTADVAVIFHTSNAELVFFESRRHVQSVDYAPRVNPIKDGDIVKEIPGDFVSPVFLKATFSEHTLQLQILSIARNSDIYRIEALLFGSQRKRVVTPEVPDNLQSHNLSDIHVLRSRCSENSRQLSEDESFEAVLVFEDKNSTYSMYNLVLQLYIPSAIVPIAWSLAPAAAARDGSNGEDRKSETSSGESSQLQQLFGAYGIPTIIGVLALALMLYIGVKRRKNRQIQQANEDPFLAYAQAMGFGDETTPKAKGGASSTTKGRVVVAQGGKAEHVSEAFEHGGQTVDQLGIEVRGVNTPESYQVKGIEGPDGQFATAHVNPLVPQTGKASVQNNSGDRDQIGSAFTLQQRKINTVNVDGARRLSSLQVGVGANPMQAAHVSSYGAEKPQLEFVQLGTNNSPPANKVRVVSVGAPTLSRASRKAGQSPTIRLALASKVDTSSMGTVDRSILKLRQWKAKIMGELPPMVEVQVDGEDESEGKTEIHRPAGRRQSYMNRLKFAQMKGGVRSELSQEAGKHSESKRTMLVRHQSRRKEFAPALPSSADIENPLHATATIKAVRTKKHNRPPERKRR